MGDYQMPDYSKRAESWKQTEQLKKDYIAGLEKQNEIAQQSPKALQQEQQASLGAFNRKSAIGMAQNQGTLGGGRGLALARQAAMDYGVGEANIRSEYGGKMQQALQHAAAAQTELSTEKLKAAQAEQLRQAKVNTSLDSAKAILTSEANKQYFTFNDEDKGRVAAMVRQQVLNNETDPDVIQAVENWIHNLQYGLTDVEGLIG